MINEASLPSAAPTRDKGIGLGVNPLVLGMDNLHPATRVLSPTSIGGTPRNSGEFYSASNNSTETLASEYLPQERQQLSSRATHARQPSILRPAKNSKVAETLMIGYGQLTGAFTVDGSLVDQAPFEEVKRKDVIGRQGGGGLVRAGAAKRDSGLLGSLGWSSIGGSIGGLLGANELSSINQTKSKTSTKSIPILSTPQTVLFVNLQLRPGESRTFSFRHSLPRGIPPTHKGRALKISYNLVIGTQRPANAKQQHQVQRVDVPFRVLPSLNGRKRVLNRLERI